MSGRWGCQGRLWTSVQLHSENSGNAGTCEKPGHVWTFDRIYRACRQRPVERKASSCNFKTQLWKTSIGLSVFMATDSLFHSADTRRSWSCCAHSASQLVSMNSALRDTTSKAVVLFLEPRSEQNKALRKQHLLMCQSS